MFMDPVNPSLLRLGSTHGTAQHTPVYTIGKRGDAAADFRSSLEVCCAVYKES
jgi:hypothetical protein